MWPSSAVHERIDTVGLHKLGWFGVNGAFLSRQRLIMPIRSPDSFSRIDLRSLLIRSQDFLQTSILVIHKLFHVRLNLVIPVGRGEVESGRKLVARFLKNCITESADRSMHLILVSGIEIVVLSWRHLNLTVYYQTALLFLNNIWCCLDSFAYHPMPESDSNPHQQSCTRPLKDALPTELLRCGHL